jgi:8-oxo-dGTP pyrophosphatase MutT (NUDIX family)
MMLDPARLPRLTVAAIVPDGERYLLVEERIGGRHVLNQPAGHVDPGEGVLAAVVRETLEETGWQVEPEAVLGIHQLVLPHIHYVRLAILCRAVGADPTHPLDSEIIRPHWLRRAEIAAHEVPCRSPLVLRCIDEHRSGRRFPLDLIAAPIR